MRKFSSRITEVFTDIGKSLNVFSSNDNYKINDIKIKSDTEALKDDWNAVGNSLREYMK